MHRVTGGGVSGSSNIGIERGGEVTIEIRFRPALQDVSDPRVALEGLQAQVPDARRQTGMCDTGEIVGLLSR